FTSLLILYSLSLHAALPISFRRLRFGFEFGDLALVGRRMNLLRRGEERTKRRSRAEECRQAKETTDRNPPRRSRFIRRPTRAKRSEEHTSELQSRFDLVCRL